MAKIFKWGIVGCGKIAGKFASDLALVPNAQLWAVASRSIEKATAFGEKFGATKYYGTYQELANDNSIDVIYIATPHAFHRENTLMCLEAGIPVLCEKPMALNVGEVEVMVNKAREKSVFLMEAIWTQFIPAFKKMLEIVKSGRIGTLRLVKADFGFKAAYDVESRLFNRNLGGGSLLDVGIYPIFLSKVLLGNPNTIQASAIMTPTEVDESCAMIFQYDHSAMALLDASIGLHTPTEAHIFGEKGSITIHTRFHQPSKLSIYDEDRNLQEEIVLDYLGNGYGYEIEEVQECLQAGRTESDNLPLNFSIELMQIMDEVRKQCGIIYPSVDL